MKCRKCENQFEAAHSSQRVCHTCANAPKEKPKQWRRFCACGNHATRQVGGRNEFECERCYQLERQVDNNFTSGRGSSVAAIDWPSVGATWVMP